MKIYLDNCCFNRPYDDQSQLRIKLESEAKLKIQTDIQEGKLDLVWSYIIEAENEANPFVERKRAIKEWKNYAIMNIGEEKIIVAIQAWLVIPAVAERNAGISTLSKEIPVSSYRRNRNDRSMCCSKMHG